MTQSHKGQKPKPKPKPKLSDKEQSERFMNAAQEMGADGDADFQRVIKKVLTAKTPEK